MHDTRDPKRLAAEMREAERRNAERMGVPPNKFDVSGDGRWVRVPVVGSDIPVFRCTWCGLLFVERLVHDCVERVDAEPKNPCLRCKTREADYCARCLQSDRRQAKGEPLPHPGDCICTACGQAWLEACYEKDEVLVKSRED